MPRLPLLALLTLFAGTFSVRPLAAQHGARDTASALLAQATDLRAWGTPQDAPRVSELLERAAAAFERAGDARGVALVLTRLGRVHADANQLDSALIRYRAAMDLAVTLGDTGLQAAAEEQVGRAHQQAERLDSALVAYRAALEMAHRGRDTAAETRLARAVRETEAMRLLNSSPLLEPTMGVVAGARHVQDVRAALASVTGFDPDTITSVEQATEALERALSEYTVYADIRSVPAGLSVRYRRVLEGAGQERTVTTSDRIPLRPALYLFIVNDPRTGQSVAQRKSCATHCRVVFNLPPAP